MKRQPQLCVTIPTQPKADGTRATKRHPPKLHHANIEMYDSRPLLLKERKSLLALLQPGHDDETRCAAAHVILRLGIEEAGPLMKGLRAQAPPIVQSAFDLAIRFMKRMETRSEIPHPGEQLGVLMVMRNSDKSAERHYADIVLQKADIKYGTPLLQEALDNPAAHGMFETPPIEMLAQLEYAFRVDADKADRLPERIRKKMGLEPKKG
jgi:hypothetical protein